MGFRRYVAASAREAMDRIRKELGPDAVILSNRRSNKTGRVEIIAAAPGEMRALVEDFAPAVAPEAQREPALALRDSPVLASARARAPAQAAPESFQEFIRRQTPQSARAGAVAMYEAVSQEPLSDAVHESVRQREVRPPARVEADAPAVFRRRPSRLDGVPAAAASAPAVAAVTQATQSDLAVASGGAAPTPVSDVSQSIASVDASPAPSATVSPVATKPVSDPGVMAELQSLRSTLTERISHLEKQVTPIATPPRPDAGAHALALKRQAMTRLLMSGFSPELARRLAESVPPNLDGKETEPWLQNSLAQQIHCAVEADNALFMPGAVALVGPTGVGKTTTVAKLAARFVVRHGAGALGLITLDSYRMGAHEQLRSYGRILGVPAQVAHDAASLRDLLRSMHGKRKVLIDTCGMSQRDQRLGEMLAMLAEARFTDQEVSRVLLVNAASHAETLDEVARAWRVSGTHGAILTKIDEAARIGGGLDALIRYQLPLLGLTNGQRVPEDWHPGNAGLLAHIALKPFGAAFCLDNAEIQSMTSAGAALV